jgi:hydroxyacylglutathione hydrolase
MKTPILIVAESKENVLEAVTRLARVGCESVKGYLDGGIEVWHESGLQLATVPQITVDELNQLVTGQKPPQILDVRRPPEYESGHVPRAHAAPLLNLQQNISNLRVDPAKPTAVICAGGYRSSAATSILEQHGFTNLMNVTGGISAWIAAGYPVEQ